VIGRRTYTALLYLFTPVWLMALAWRVFRRENYRQQWHQRLGYASITASEVPCLWIHAASVGEVAAAVSLVRSLRQSYPAYRILLTTVTPTGAARVRALSGEGIDHAYIPFDYPFMVRQFLRRVRPKLAVIIETEIWPNLFYACHQRNIPLVLASVRLSERSVQGYQRVPNLARQTLSWVTLAAAQTPVDAERLRLLGMPADRVSVLGNLKFDMIVPDAIRQAGQQWRAQIGADRPVWVAASTHAGEETQVLTAARAVLTRFPTALLLLAPRHPERFDAVARLCTEQGFVVTRRSEDTVPDGQTQIFLLDSMGELPKFFAATDVAFVGGSLVPVGGHNLLEPAVQGVPIVTGPHTFNFTEIHQLLDDIGGVCQASNATELAVTVVGWFEDKAAARNVGEAGQRLVEQHRGATQRLLSWVAPLIG